tara:strand:- start:159 stop:602 length:444 start_codon:yes stop_codon:yes gene_type:complete
MKIYVTNIKRHDMNETFITKYKCKTENITLILSDIGIITCNENKLILNKIIDKPTEKRELGDFSFLCDSSYYAKDRIVYQVPTSHITDNIVKTTYKMSSKSELMLVTERIKNSSAISTDFYFETRENMDVAYIKADILSFLTELKFC